MRKAKRFLQKTTIFFVGVLTILGMSGLPSLAATVTDVTVSTDVIQVKFDTEVITGNPLTSWELGVPAVTNSAADFRAYSFQYPSGTAYPLSRFGPYENTTEIGFATPTYNLDIYYFHLTAGQTWKLSGSSGTHVIKTTSPTEEVAAFAFADTAGGI